MSHDSLLVATIAAGITVAFIFGLIAVRIGLPPIVGYVLAGVAVGPFTPGYVADAGLAQQFASLGVILLMFGVGLRFSLGELAGLRGVVVPAALTQTTITTSLGTALGVAWGWGAGGGLVLGLSLGVASTVAMLKSLEGRDRLDSREGHLAIGWLVVEDLTMVFVLVLLPAIAPGFADGTGRPAADIASVAVTAAIALAKVILFIALMYFVGRRFVPWLLLHVAGSGSRELFTLAVFGTALGVGTIAADLFGVSFALGAFFAGAVISESELSQRAAADALPMQDAFAVLFFVSVGMLFDPAIVVTRPVQLALLVGVVIVWKSALSFGLLRFFGQPKRTAILVGTGLGQIGEFSFILAATGISLGLISREAQALIVAASLIAITANAPLLSIITRLATRRESRREREAAGAATEPGRPAPSAVVLVGYGRVGATIAEALRRAAISYVVVEEQERTVRGLRSRGERAVHGDGTRADVLERAGIADARLLVVTAPDPFRARQIVEQARAANPSLAVAVRTHSAAEQQFFEQHLSTSAATGRAVYAEREAALSLAHYALLTLGQTDDLADAVLATMRGELTAPTETFETLAAREDGAPGHRDRGTAESRAGAP
ncbi:MAG TPA: cation:proton antiporter [Gemmatimonadaceae bacterium]|nr:cation:proton antiporter [Gemmatimonadaceae bacterium]